MTRRSTPQAKIDDRAFPVRVLIEVPTFGVREDIHGWLDATFGRANFAVHGGGRTIGLDTFALYLRHPDHASAFLAAFPRLELADGTKAVWYRSPHLPSGRPQEEDEQVCNRYSITTTQEAMRRLFDDKVLRDRAGNLQSGLVFPDQLAPIIRHGEDGAWELAKARWGMPSPKGVLKTARDPGITNIRNISSPHWRRWLGPAHRCLVPVTAFAEPIRGGNQWFVPAADDTLMFFAGIEVRQHRSLRKVKDGETVDDLFGFLTTSPNREVAEVHPKAMPVILLTPTEWELWMSAPFEIAATMQRALPDGSLKAVDEPV